MTGHWIFAPIACTAGQPCVLIHLPLLDGHPTFPLFGALCFGAHILQQDMGAPHSSKPLWHLFIQWERPAPYRQAASTSNTQSIPGRLCQYNSITLFTYTSLLQQPPCSSPLMPDIPPSSWIFSLLGYGLAALLIFLCDLLLTPCKRAVPVPLKELAKQLFVGQCQGT